MRVYLDMCCFNRPYDDQSQFRISLETQAKIRIQELIKEGEIDLITSYILQHENDKNPIEGRRLRIDSFARKYSKEYISSSDKAEIESVAKEIRKTGVKDKDALHVSCAIKAKCDYFITTDKRLLKYSDDKIKMVNPLEYIALEVDKDE